ncbi:UNKNOWN [Stylonychia lemnae]|uniref:Uncharacterized protein n=1 Tax=Stylonychia lemnae TaxID=5949 RepID=A0A078A6D4_STYLE|nr:UNKNOWN [Stylonychia lemnae]|eukprot:CDW77820.1 UNKNOWN [Stylonychia lemnae]
MGGSFKQYIFENSTLVNIKILPGCRQNKVVSAASINGTTIDVYLGEYKEVIFEDWEYLIPGCLIDNNYHVEAKIQALDFENLFKTVDYVNISKLNDTQYKMSINPSNHSLVGLQQLYMLNQDLGQIITEQNVSFFLNIIDSCQIKELIKPSFKYYQEYHLGEISMIYSIDPEDIGSYQVIVKGIIQSKEIVLQQSYEFTLRVSSQQLKAYNEMPYFIEPLPDMSFDSLERHIYQFPPIKGFQQNGMSIQIEEQPRFATINSKEIILEPTDEDIGSYTLTIVFIDNKYGQLLSKSQMKIQIRSNQKNQNEQDILVQQYLQETLTDFTFNDIKIQKKQLAAKLKANQTLGQELKSDYQKKSRTTKYDVMQIKINKKYFFVSDDLKKVVDSDQNLYHEIPPQMPNTVLGLSLKKLWMLIQTLQIIVHLPMLQVPLPANVIFCFSQIIDISNLNVIPKQYIKEVLNASFDDAMSIAFAMFMIIYLISIIIVIAFFFKIYEQQLELKLRQRQLSKKEESLKKNDNQNNLNISKDHNLTSANMIYKSVENDLYKSFNKPAKFDQQNPIFQFEQDCFEKRQKRSVKKKSKYRKRLRSQIDIQNKIDPIFIEDQILDKSPKKSIKVQMLVVEMDDQTIQVGEKVQKCLPQSKI